MAGRLDMTRRAFLALAAAVPLAGAWAAPSDKQALLFKVRGKAALLGEGERLGFMNTDGTGFRTFDFGRPNEIGWGPYAFFKDGRRAVLMSIEKDDDWKTKTFDEYYHKSRTHVWICDLESGALTEIAQKERIAPFYAPCALLPGEERMLMSVMIGHVSVLHSMNLDGTDAKAITQPGEFVYGVSPSPDGQRIAFHADYQIQVMSIDGTNRKALTDEKGIIHFGTSWSPDGEWVLFQVCNPSLDPGHDWSDIWIAKADGSEKRALTTGNTAWFASSYGTPDNHGNGSIMPQWAPDGSGILYAQRTPDARLPWEFQKDKPDTNHFGREFKPEQARGGTRISLLNPKDGSSTPLTHETPPQWEFRPEWSSDSRRIFFCRAGVGGNPAIWVMDRDGSNPKRLTDGFDHQGVDFPRFVPAG